MTDGNEDCECIGVGRRSGSIDAGGDVDVEGGLGGDEVLFEDGVEGFTVGGGEEDVVGCEGGCAAIKCPVKGYAAAGGGAAGVGCSGG